MPAEAFAKVWYAYADSGDYSVAAQAAAEAGVACDAKQVRDHFSYCRPTQPPPRGNLRRQFALSRAEQLPERSRRIMLLVGRVPALSGSQIAELFYWTGNPKQYKSAQNGCYRDLKKLMYQDFLYRYYPEAQGPSSNKRRGRQEHLALYFLGRDAVPYVELAERYEPQRGEWVSGIEDERADAFILREHDANEVVCSLARQAKKLAFTGEPVSIEGIDLDVELQPENWFAGRRASVHFRDLTSRESIQLPLGALVAFSVRFPGLVDEEGGQRSVLAPMAFEYYPGTRPPEQIAAKLLRYAQAGEVGAIGERFPDLAGRGWLPPIVIVCRDAERVARVQAAAQRFARQHQLLRTNRPTALICDARTVAERGLAGRVWMSVWDRPDSDRRHLLLKWLIAHARPFFGRLDAQHLLRCDARAASRPTPGGPSSPAPLPEA
jgi:hypothetical protein